MEKWICNRCGKELSEKPYKNQTCDCKGKCDDYNLNFDSKEFYEWVKSRDYQVFFSSYEISDVTFYKQKIKSVMSLIGADTNGKKVNEYIYSNKPIKTEKVE